MPTTFTDARNREWSLALTVGSLGAVRRDTGAELGGFFRSPEALTELLFADPEQLVKVLWVLVAPQAAAATPPVTPEAFADGFDGPAVGRAAEALTLAVADLFPLSAVAAAVKRDFRGIVAAADRAAADRIDRAAAAERSPAADPTVPASTAT